LLRVSALPSSQDFPKRRESTTVGAAAKVEGLPSSQENSQRRESTSANAVTEVAALATPPLEHSFRLIVEIAEDERPTRNTSQGDSVGTMLRSSLHAVPDYIPVTVRRSSHGKSAKKWFHRHRWTNKSKISVSPINRSDRRWDFNAFSEPEQSDDQILEEEEEEESQGEFVVKKKKMKRERVVASKGAVKARQKTRTSMNMSLLHRTGSEKGEKRFSVYIYIYGPEAHTCSPPPHQL
jgi:hypothetical protein